MNADELSLSECENLEIIGAGDGDGWLLVCTVDDSVMTHTYSHNRFTALFPGPPG